MQKSNSSFEGGLGSSYNSTNMNASGQRMPNDYSNLGNNGVVDVNAISYLRNNQGHLSPTNCSHCHQYFANNQAYAEHENTCPVRSRAIQYLQLLEQQQLQLNQQFQEQQAQVNHSALSMGRDLDHAQYCMPALPAPTINYHQGLETLQQGIEINESADGLIQEDHFDTLVNQLPAFNPPSAKDSDRLTPPPESKSTEYFPLALIPEDEKSLTPLHCFVRKYCVEVFVATAADVDAPCMGKRKAVSIGQVGIRCPYCSPKNSYEIAHRNRENGVVYPSVVGRIYNATINLLQRHLKTCCFVPHAVVARYDELKKSNERSGASKTYWIDSAKRMGLYDTPNGIGLNTEMYLQFKMNAKREEVAAGSNNNAISHEVSNAPSLVLPSDKRFTTTFTFHLMAQLQPCAFTEADRLGRRRNLSVGFAGMACRHCVKSSHCNGRFFPSSVKTMSDASKTIDPIYKHISQCSLCPDDVKQGLKSLKEFHESEKSKMPFGNQRSFFARIFGRLHGNDKEPSMPAASATKDSKPPALKHKSDSPDSLHSLYAQLNKSNADMRKLTNEAA